MNRLFRVAILYQPPGGRPLCIARADDPALLAGVARAALQEADDKAVYMSLQDPILGRVQFEEAARLRRVLEPMAGQA